MGWNKRLQCYDWLLNCFAQPINNKIKTYETIRKIATGKGYSYLKDHYKMIAVDLSKKKALDAYPTN